MKKNFRTIVSIASILPFVAYSLPAAAQSAGSNVVDIGWQHLAPHSSADTLDSTSSPFLGLSLTGSNKAMDVSNADTVNFAITHFWTDNFATMLDAGLPTRLRFSGNRVDFVGNNFNNLGSAKQWNPSIVAKWYFGDANSAFRPYIGAGISYVKYSDAEMPQAYQDAAALSSTPGAGRASMHLSSSWAPVANIGGTYRFYKNWSLGLSVSYIPIKTNVDVTTTGGDFGPHNSRSSITINPLVTFLSLGYSF